MLPDTDLYYLYVPSAGAAGTGTCYSLEPSASLPKKGLIIVPYAHPRKEKILPQYYVLQNERQVIADSEKETEVPAVLFKPTLSREEYIKKVQQLKKHIARGNIYEINFCMEFRAEKLVIDPVQVFRNLFNISKAPYNFLVRLQDEYILCASPELFLKKEGRQLITKPIKGTARRGKDKLEDEQLKEQLANSLKERTENVMAVDVARNDLSMLAARGSVSVNKLYNIETFETVHQMVSTVRCELRDDPDFEVILGATFPMASMTGAPKTSAMNLIADSENFRRSFYSGALGLCNDGDFELAVVIRSLFYNAQRQVLKFAVGGAITHLCDPEKEYEECLLKAQSMLRAVNGTLS